MVSFHVDGLDFDAASEQWKDVQCTFLNLTGWIDI